MEEKISEFESNEMSEKNLLVVKKYYLNRLKELYKMFDEKPESIEIIDAIENTLMEYRNFLTYKCELRCLINNISNEYDIHPILGK